jgi:hypothetical protein
MEPIIIKGEPKEVSEIREKILNSFNELIFVEEGHKYYLRGEELQSVSHVTHQFEPQSDWDAIATNYALKHGETKEYWQDQWRYNSLKATIRGTLTHEYGESIAWLRNGFPEKICPSCACKHVENWLVPTHPKEEAILKFWDELPPNLYFVLAETKVYSGVNPNIAPLNKNYAGTFDLLFYYKDPVDDSKSGLVICDYKGLPLDTPIATTNGWKTMGTIQEGDCVFDKNGKPTKVLHTSSVHHNPCYKIQFENDEIVADCDHRWEVSFPCIENTDGKKYITKVMTTQEIKTYIDTHPHDWPKIINNAPLSIEDGIFEVESYHIGVLLSNTNESLTEERVKFLNNNTKDFCDILLQCSFNQKIDILRGLMDSSGSYDEKINAYTLNTKNNKDECIVLLSSLGIKPYTHQNEINFRTNIPLLGVTNAQIDELDTFRTIICVDEVETVPTRCIEVDSETHTFCCGYNMLVTHNTNKELIKDFSRARDKMLLHPFERFYDEAQSLYTLQLSCYQIPLEDIGLKVIGRRLIHLKEDGTYEKIPLPDVTKELRNTL